MIDIAKPDQITEAASSKEESDSELLEIVLHIADGNLRDELTSRPEGATRHDFAVDAMRIGVLAIQQASGRIDADRVRHEGDRLIRELAQVLSESQRSMTGELVGRLKEYFDPNDGRFTERLERLVRRDGELEQVLKRLVGAEDSELQKTLSGYFGSL